VVSALDAIDRPARTAPDSLDRILLASLEALAAAGETDAACRLAGQACAALRQQDAAAWRRFNALLHRLVLRPPGRAANA
jgi:hypothetical protein